jgi:hypothetical protein
VRGRIEIPNLVGEVDLELDLIQLLDEGSGAFGSARLRVPVEIE